MGVLSTLQLIAPELEQAYTTEQLEQFIELAGMQVGPKFCNRDLAVAYLAAHMATISSRKGIGGSINSLSEGGLSISAGAVGGVVGMTEFHTTSYGTEFERLKRQCIFAARNKMVR
jgi:hypothetical protein